MDPRLRGDDFFQSFPDVVCCTQLALLFWLFALWTAASCAVAADPAYPTRPVRVVVGFAPGGGADATGRIFATKMSQTMGQNWVVDNRTGAGGNLSSEIVATSNPDGHTVLVFLDSQLTANPTLYSLPFSVEKDLLPVAILASTDMVVVVHPALAAKTFKEFVALAKAKPGTLHYGSGGIGSANHLTAELIKKATGAEIVHVPYKGAGPSIAGILAGEIQMNVSSPASTIAFITSGRLRAIARTGDKRTKQLPEVPTIAESGYPGFNVIQWYGLAVRATTPKSIVERLRTETLKALESPDMQGYMEKLGLEPGDAPQQKDLTGRLKKETAVWAGVIKAAGIRVQ